MELCNKKHVEIVYESSPCPLCEAIEYVEELKAEIKELENK